MTKATRWKKLITALLFAGSMLSMSGCWLVVVGAAAGAGAATIAYVDGDLVATYGHGFDQVVAATKQAISQLGYANPEERKDVTSDVFNTHTARGDSVKIVVTRTSETSTKVDIRIGTFGDETLSMQINDKIKANLP